MAGATTFTSKSLLLSLHRTTRDLQTCYTPQPDEFEWARRSTRGERPRLGLLVLLKVFQQMHHFPPLDSIPAAIV